MESFNERDVMASKRRERVTNLFRHEVSGQAGRLLSVRFAPESGQWANIGLVGRY